MKAIRESKGMSQTKLAEFSGLNRSEIWKLETGYQQPRTETLLKITEGLSVKIQDLFIQTCPDCNHYGHGVDDPPCLIGKDTADPKCPFFEKQ